MEFSRKAEVEKKKIELEFEDMKQEYLKTKKEITAPEM